MAVITVDPPDSLGACWLFHISVYGVSGACLYGPSEAVRKAVHPVLGFVETWAGGYAVGMTWFTANLLTDEEDWETLRSLVTQAADALGPEAEPSEPEVTVARPAPRRKRKPKPPSKPARLKPREVESVSARRRFRAGDLVRAVQDHAGKYVWLLPTDEDANGIVKWKHGDDISVNGVKLVRAKGRYPFTAGDIVTDPCGDRHTVRVDEAPDGVVETASGACFFNDELTLRESVLAMDKPARRPWRAGDRVQFREPPKGTPWTLPHNETADGKIASHLGPGVMVDADAVELMQPLPRRHFQAGDIVKYRGEKAGEPWILALDERPHSVVLNRHGGNIHASEIELAELHHTCKRIEEGRRWFEAGDVVCVSPEANPHSTVRIFTLATSENAQGKAWSECGRELAMHGCELMSSAAAPEPTRLFRKGDVVRHRPTELMLCVDEDQTGNTVRASGYSIYPASDLELLEGGDES